MRPLGGSFVPTEEVDEVRWAPPTKQRRSSATSGYGAVPSSAGLRARAHDELARAARRSCKRRNLDRVAVVGQPAAAGRGTGAEDQEQPRRQQVVATVAVSTPSPRIHPLFDELFRFQRRQLRPLSVTLAVAASQHGGRVASAPSPRRARPGPSTCTSTTAHSRRARPSSAARRRPGRPPVGGGVRSSGEPTTGTRAHTHRSPVTADRTGSTSRGGARGVEQRSRTAHLADAAIAQERRRAESASGPWQAAPRRRGGSPHVHDPCRRRELSAATRRRAQRLRQLVLAQVRADDPSLGACSPADGEGRIRPRGGRGEERGRSDLAARRRSVARAVSRTEPRSTKSSQRDGPREPTATSVERRRRRRRSVVLAGHGRGRQRRPRRRGRPSFSVAQHPYRIRAPARRCKELPGCSRSACPGQSGNVERLDASCVRAQSFWTAFAAEPTFTSDSRRCARFGAERQPHACLVAARSRRPRRAPRADGPFRPHVDDPDHLRPCRSPISGRLRAVVNVCADPVNRWSARLELESHDSSS